MKPREDQKASNPSPQGRLVLVLTGLPPRLRKARSIQRSQGFSSLSKRKTAPCSAAGLRPQQEKAEGISLKQHLQQLKMNPSLSRLFKESVHVKRLSTPTMAPKRLPLPLRKAIINWVTHKSRPLLNSSTLSLGDLHVDPDISVLPLAELSSAATLSIPPISPVKAAACKPHIPLLDTKIRKETGVESDRKVKPIRLLSRSVSKISLEKIGLREVLRDREWVGKAREQVKRDFCRVIRASNGVSVEPGENCVYSYYLGRGNNHPLVKACFKVRAWSRVARVEGMKECNVVWTQGKIKRLFRGFQTSSPCLNSPKPSRPISLSCTVKYHPKYSSDPRARLVDISCLNHSLITLSPSFLQLPTTASLPSPSLRTHNKLEFNYHLTNKKTLFFSIKTYAELMGFDPFSIIPVTFHISEGVADPEYSKFVEYYRKIARESEKTGVKNLWIVKPGENTNRGSGISVCNSLEQVRNEVSSPSIYSENGQKRTYILQKYIENPLLLNKRKFDIRCYSLITSINGVLQAYFYQEGYLRTSSREFNLKDTGNRLIHLTNDAVQKYSEDYGRYEAGNKLSYSDLQRYFDTHYPGKSVQKDLIEQVKGLVLTTVSATFPKLNTLNRMYAFEVLGYDFMVDAELKVWLIEVNTNPCLELSSPLLARIIPAMLDNAFRIAIDPYFPETYAGKRPGLSVTGEVIAENRFELIFSSLVEGEAVAKQLGVKYVRLATIDTADYPSDAEEDSVASLSSEEGC